MRYIFLSICICLLWNTSNAKAHKPTKAKTVHTAKGDNPIKSKECEQKWNTKCQKCEVRSFVPQLDEEGKTPHSKIRCFPSRKCEKNP